MSQCLVSSSKLTEGLLCWINISIIDLSIAGSTKGSVKKNHQQHPYTCPETQSTPCQNQLVLDSKDINMDRKVSTSTDKIGPVSRCNKSLGNHGDC